MRLFSAVPSGLDPRLEADPRLESLGYFQKSLRDTPKSEMLPPVCAAGCRHGPAMARRAAVKAQSGKRQAAGVLRFALTALRLALASGPAGFGRSGRRLRAQRRTAQRFSLQAGAFCRPAGRGFGSPW